MFAAAELEAGGYLTFSDNKHVILVLGTDLRSLLRSANCRHPKHRARPQAVGSAALAKHLLPMATVRQRLGHLLFFFALLHLLFLWKATFSTTTEHLLAPMGPISTSKNNHKFVLLPLFFCRGVCTFGVVTALRHETCGLQITCHCTKPLCHKEKRA